eukprot:PITA_27709
MLGETPKTNALYRMSTPDFMEFKLQLKEMIEKGYIRPGVPPWGAPVLFVKNKDSNIRLCIDYRQLNKVRIKEKDIYKTSFQMRNGNYEFVVVPYGLTNASTTFMCLMNIVLHPYLEMFVIIFIDDILIYSKNDEENVEHLIIVLRLIIEHQLYSKISKCCLFQTKINYLGHVVSKEGIEVGLENIRAIMEWETPSNVDEVRQFMGLSSYYRSSIRNFLWITYPITSLHQKGKKFE